MLLVFSKIPYFSKQVRNDKKKKNNFTKGTNYIVTQQFLQFNVCLELGKVS